MIKENPYTLLHTAYKCSESEVWKLCVVAAVNYNSSLMLPCRYVETQTLSPQRF